MFDALFQREERDATDKATVMMRGVERLTSPLLSVSATTCANACVCVQLVHCVMPASNKHDRTSGRKEQTKCEQAATARASACTCGWPDTLGGNLPRGKSLSCHGHAVPSSSGLARQVAGELSVDALFQREEKKTQQTKLQRCCEVKRDKLIRCSMCRPRRAQLRVRACNWCTV